MDGDGDGGRWLTYAQLAETRGITRKAAIRMTQRHRWRRQPGNDGTALVWVPHADLTPRQPPPRQPSRQTPRQTPDDDGDGGAPGISLMAGALAALEDAVAALRDQLARSEARADRLAPLAEERGRLVAQVVDLQRELDAARAAAQEAQKRADALAGATAARQARGRLRRAWDGWRGEGKKAKDDDTEDQIRYRAAACNTIAGALFVAGFALPLISWNTTHTLPPYWLVGVVVGWAVAAITFRMGMAELRKLPPKGPAIAPLDAARAEGQARGLVARLRAAWRGA